MDLKLSGKGVVITGGTKGIGKAIGEEFLREGARVAVFSRNPRRVEEFLEEMGGRYGRDRVFGRALDVSQEEAVEAFAREAAGQFGGIQVWVNNAGVAINKPFLEFTPEDWSYINEINLGGVWRCSRAAARQMMGQEGGVIINISSYAALIPHAGGAIYAATKAGVSSLTKTLAAELAPYNIRVVGIIPGMIETDIARENIGKYKENYVREISMKRLGRPEDLAKPAVFLASPAAGYITGTDIEITGGKYAVQNSDWAWEVKDSK